MFFIVLTNYCASFFSYMLDLQTVQFAFLTRNPNYTFTLIQWILGKEKSLVLFP